MDKLKDQRRFISVQLEQANRSLDDFGENMKKQTETLRDEVNNLSADLFQNENQRNDTEYTVGRVNINTNNIDYRTPGHLTEREDRLFKSLQELLNKAGFQSYPGFFRTETSGQKLSDRNWTSTTSIFNHLISSRA